MDPFLVQTTPVKLQPFAGAQDPGTSALLREGRILAGQVLQRLDGGSLVIGIGEQRVPAESRVELEPGERFTLEVEGQGCRELVRPLDSIAPEEPALVSALRRVMGRELPMGELLTRLATDLQAHSEAEPEAANPATELLAGLAEHVFDPDSGGEALRDRLLQGGTGYEQKLLDLALRNLSSDEMSWLSAELHRAVLELLFVSQDGGGESRQVFSMKLGAALTRDLAHKAGSGTPEGVPETVIEEPLTALLARALGRLSASAHTRLLQHQAVELLRRTALDRLPPRLSRALLLRFLGATAPADSTIDPNSPNAQVLPAELERLRGDLKAKLLRTLALLPDGRAKESVGRALQALEAEQLLNLARRESGEPLHWSLALLEGSRWKSARVFFRNPGDSQARTGTADEDRPHHRIVVAVDFSHTGPVRADLLIRGKALTLRFHVTRPRLAERLRRELGELEQRLSSGGRRVELSVSLAAEDEVRVGTGLGDIAFLRQHRLVDRMG